MCSSSRRAKPRGRKPVASGSRCSTHPQGALNPGMVKGGLSATWWAVAAGMVGSGSAWSPWATVGWTV